MLRTYEYRVTSDNPKLGMSLYTSTTCMFATDFENGCRIFKNVFAKPDSDNL